MRAKHNEGRGRGPAKYRPLFSVVMTAAQPAALAALARLYNAGRKQRAFAVANLREGVKAAVVLATKSKFKGHFRVSLSAFDAGNLK